MKHAYAELFTAKLNDTSLVLFEKHEEWKEWREVGKSDKIFVVCGNFDYFLCLPQHKEVCLHWLNGGKLMIDNGKGLGEGRYTMDIRRNNPLADFIGHPEYTFRIKPMIEKVWVAYHKDGFMFSEVGGSECDIDDRVKNHELSDFVKSDWQYKEIEVTE